MKIFKRESHTFNTYWAAGPGMQGDKAPVSSWPREVLTERFTWAHHCPSVSLPLPTAGAWVCGPLGVAHNRLRDVPASGKGAQLSLQGSRDGVQQCFAFLLPLRRCG